MAVLNRTKPYATSLGHPTIAFIQNEVCFDHQGNEIVTAVTEAKAEVEKPAAPTPSKKAKKTNAAAKYAHPQGLE